MTKALEIWISAYGAKNEVGITRAELLTDTAELVKTAEYGNIENPSFLRVNKSGTRLYAVSEVEEHIDVDGDKAEGGQLASFPIDAESRKLGPGQYHPTHGAHPCHLSLTPEEDWLAVANYSGESVMLYPVRADERPGPPSIRFRHTGSGPDADRQQAPHPHSATFSPDGQYLFVADLGMDKIMTYARDTEGSQWVAHDATSLEAGAGSRHLVFHPSGKALYAVNELDSTVTHFAYEAGKLTREETISTLPSSFTGKSWCAEIAASPDGRFLYVSNRGHDSIAVLAVDESGMLSPAGYVSTRGEFPRHFALSPDGQWLVAANQNSDSVVLFRIEPQSGLPVYAGAELAVNKPVCVVIR